MPRPPESTVAKVRFAWGTFKIQGKHACRSVRAINPRSRARRWRSQSRRLPDDQRPRRQVPQTNHCPAGPRRLHIGGQRLRPAPVHRRQITRWRTTQRFRVHLALARQTGCARQVLGHHPLPTNGGAICRRTQHRPVRQPRRNRNRPSIPSAGGPGQPAHAASTTAPDSQVIVIGNGCAVASVVRVPPV